MTLRKIHFTSGVILTLFIGLHLFNHLCSVAGAEEHIAMMNTLRPVYRNLFVETILLSAVVVQIVTGLTLFKVSIKAEVSFFGRLHVWTGMYLAFFLLLHTSAVLIGRTVLHLDTNFYFGVAGLNTFPFNLFFIPYYALAILSFAGHVAAIHYKKMDRFLLGISIYKQSMIILGIGVAITLIIFFGLTNHFHGVDIPKEYNVLIGK